MQQHGRNMVEIVQNSLFVQNYSGDSVFRYPFLFFVCFCFVCVAFVLNALQTRPESFLKRKRTLLTLATFTGLVQSSHRS